MFQDLDVKRLYPPEDIAERLGVSTEALVSASLGGQGPPIFHLWDDLYAYQPAALRSWWYHILHGSADLEPADPYLISPEAREERARLRRAERRQARLRLAEKRRQSDDPWLCPHCGQRFGTDGGLKTHMGMMHKTEGIPARLPPLPPLPTGKGKSHAVDPLVQMRSQRWALEAVEEPQVLVFDVEDVDDEPARYDPNRYLGKQQLAEERLARSEGKDPPPIPAVGSPPFSYMRTGEAAILAGISTEAFMKLRSRSEGPPVHYRDNDRPRRSAQAYYWPPEVLVWKEHDLPFIPPRRTGPGHFEDTEPGRTAEMARLAEEGMSLRAIGERFDLSRERVRQILQRAGVNTYRSEANRATREADAEAAAALKLYEQALGAMQSALDNDRHCVTCGGWIIRRGHPDVKTCSIECADLWRLARYQISEDERRRQRLAMARTVLRRPEKYSAGQAEHARQVLEEGLQPNRRYRLAHSQATLALNAAGIPAIAQSKLENPYVAKPRQRAPYRCPATNLYGEQCRNMLFEEGYCYAHRPANGDGPSLES